MAGTDPLGSRRDFTYVDDSGQAWGLKLDESNTLLVNPTGDVGASTASNRLPRNIKPRFVQVTDITGQVVRKCIVLKLAAYAALTSGANFTLAATDSNAATVVAPKLVRGEKRRDVIKNFDTGKTDGTNP